MTANLDNKYGKGFSNLLNIDAHRGGGVRWGRGRVNTKRLVNKNAIKPEIGGPPQAIFPETLDLGILAKTHQVPPPLDFQPVRIYVVEPF